MNSALDAAREDARSDMTAMIDCVFLMIVFFVCVDFRVLEAKLPAYLPRDHGDWAKVEPPEELSVSIHEQRAGSWSEAGAGDGGRPARRTLRGHTVVWRIGPTQVEDEHQLLRLLRRINGDHRTWQDDPDHPGRKKPMAVVIEPHPGTYYDDAAKASDIVRAAGFAEVYFGGGLGARPR